MKEKRSLIRIFFASMEITIGTVAIIAYIAYVIWFYRYGATKYALTSDGLQALPAIIVELGIENNSIRIIGSDLDTKH